MTTLPRFETLGRVLWSVYSGLLFAFIVGLRDLKQMKQFHEWCNTSAGNDYLGCGRKGQVSAFGGVHSCGADFAWLAVQAWAYHCTRTSVQHRAACSISGGRIFANGGKKTITPVRTRFPRQLKIPGSYK